MKPEIQTDALTPNDSVIPRVCFNKSGNVSLEKL